MSKLSEKYDPKNKKSLKTIKFLTEWMDTKFTIPFTNIKFGLDPLLSLIPGAGDIISSGINLGIFALILAKGVPIKTAFKMMFNTIFDTLFSSIPFLGTIIDVGYKSNTKNLHLLEQHLKNNPNGKYEYGIWIVFGITIFTVIGIILFLVFLLLYLISKIEPTTINYY